MFSARSKRKRLIKKRALQVSLRDEALATNLVVHHVQGDRTSLGTTLAKFRHVIDAIVLVLAPLLEFSFARHR
jgi:hypothetical protein